MGVYDCCIIGTGPAGISAALNLKIHNKDFLWFGTKNLSDKVVKAEKIRNYPGIPEASGETLQAAFRAHIDEMGIGITEAMVNSILPMGDHYAVIAGPDFYETKTVILTTGVAQTGTLPGESEYLGRGVSYCATCDGGLYRGKTIAVVCGNRRFEHEVRYLSELAAKIYFFPLYKDPGVFADNVEVRKDRPVSVGGGFRVTGITLRGGETLPVDGTFFLRDSISLGSLLPKLETEDGHIAVNRGMETNLEGVFAAGDCTGRPYQYAKAVGEGNVAAHGVIEYLDRKAAGKTEA